MRKFLKQEKGVTLLTLAAVIIVMGIITTTLMYTIRDTNDTGKITNLYSDVKNLTDKVSNYYATYGKIPAIRKEAMITEIKSAIESAPESPVGANDTGDYLLLDLHALENLTLNYGKEFENVYNANTIGSYRDFFVINENSHNIFYLKGIKVNNKYYYTNQDVDQTKVNLRYVEGIKIPDGYNYLSGTKATGIIITDGTKLYKYEDGVYKNYVEDGEGDGTTISVELTEHDERAWSLPYETTKTYRDINGDTCYVPEGFMVSKLDDLNQINKGFVIKKYTPDSQIEEGKTRMDYGDEYVWISVPFDVLRNIPIQEVDMDNDLIADIRNACKDVEDALKEYTKDYKKNGYDDTWLDGCGLTEAEYYKLKYNILKSIKENNGFYVGRYEAGIENNNVVIKKEVKPYYFITISEAQNLAKNETNINYKTSLMFGVQWDLICKFIEESGEKTQYDIKTNSKNWGNYKDSSFVYKYGNDEYNKESGNAIICKTGSSNNNSSLNIYDLAGNMIEYTLQRYNSYIILRGGGYSSNGEDRPMLSFEWMGIDSKYSSCGFRVCLFK